MNQKYLKVFEQFIPPAAVVYCYKLYEHFGFEFKIKRGRLTKFGDYRFNPANKKHIITINNDLNPFAFLVTYLHEVAHLVTFEQYGRKVNPHGVEWKQNFKKIAAPVLNDQIFPTPVLQALIRYFKNPKASSCSDPILYQVLRKFDNPTDEISLKEVHIGQEFIFNGRTFKKLERKRTRSICMELDSGKRYLISEVAPVKYNLHASPEH